MNADSAKLTLQDRLLSRLGGNVPVSFKERLLLVCLLLLGLFGLLGMIMSLAIGLSSRVRTHYDWGGAAVVTRPSPPGPDKMSTWAELRDVIGQRLVGSSTCSPT